MHFEEGQVTKGWAGLSRWRGRVGCNGGRGEARVPGRAINSHSKADAALHGECDAGVSVGGVLMHGVAWFGP